MAVTASQAASLRAELNLPADPASDAIWASRPWATQQDVVTALRNRYGDQARLSPTSYSTTDPNYIPESTRPHTTTPDPYTGEPVVVDTPQDLAYVNERIEQKAEEDRLAKQAESRRNLATELAKLYPWLNGALLSVFVDAYVESGMTDLALQEVRNGKGRGLYDQIFPGNRREDGTLRHTENEYFGRKNAYIQTLEDFGLNPDLFEAQFTNLFEGEVSGLEFEARMQALDEGIAQRGEEIRMAFAEASGGINFDRTAILASLMDPDGVGESLLRRKIGVAQVRGTASKYGFNRSLARGGELFNAGVGEQAAVDFYSTAGRNLRFLDAAAKRFNDRDSTFDVEELEAGLLMSDPLQRDRVGSLTRRESSLFSRSGTVREDRAGGLAGLSER